jgi:hypothetical protein
MLRHSAISVSICRKMAEASSSVAAGIGDGESLAGDQGVEVRNEEWRIRGQVIAIGDNA